MTNPDYLPELKLGKKVGVVNDPRTFRLARLLVKADLRTPPKTSRVARGYTDFPIFRNDEIGDCGLASQGHRIIAQERSSSQSRKITLTNEDIVKAYSAVSGYDPATGANDNGVYMLDVCNYMRNTGMGTEKDGTQHTITAFAKANQKNIDEVKLALWMFGGLYVGAALPTTAAQEISNGQKWSDTTGKPYSWGGHAMYVIGYDQTGVEFVTWGRTQKATWDWWVKYVDECYVHITEDFLRTKTQKTPQGFNLDALNSALASLG